MSSINQSQIERLRREIADLGKADAREAKKEAALMTKMNRAQEAAARARSTSTLQSKLRESERAANSLASVRAKRAGISGKIAEKSKNLRVYEERQARDDERARKKMTEEQKRLARDRETHERGLRQLIDRQRTVSHMLFENQPLPAEAHDFFISHASEDKDDVVRELANALRTRGAKVWYDEFSLKVGDSLRRNIDAGLRSSRFGVVVLSENSFGRNGRTANSTGLSHARRKAKPASCRYGTRCRRMRLPVTAPHWPTKSRSIRLFKASRTLQPS
jgi:hypothetical protein